MPESNKAEKRRIQKANKAAGIGDENGRLVRVKDPPKMAQVCVSRILWLVHAQRCISTADGGLMVLKHRSEGLDGSGRAKRM